MNSQPEPSETPAIEPILTARDAIAAHLRWKMAFQLAIGSRQPIGKRPMHAIRQPDECSIGRWLLSARTADVRRTPEYKDLVACHQVFHAAMLRIATLINAGRFDAAERGLAPGSTFDQASKAIAGAIVALDQVLNHPARLALLP